MTAKKIIWIALVVIVIAGVLFLAVRRSSTLSTPVDSTGQLEYSNTQEGFSFSYPSNYTIVERSDTSSHSITLTRKGDMQNEGEPMIFIQVVPNPASTTLVKWLTDNVNYSNYAAPYLIDPSPTTTIVSDSSVPAIIYYWGGEGYGESVAFALRNNVVIFNAMYGYPSDPVKKDFDVLMKTIEVL